MKDALDVVMAWQLRNPNITDPAEAVDAVKASTNNQIQSELSSRLAAHFLRLTVRPLFSQTSQSTLTSAGHKAPDRDIGARKHDEETDKPPWKDAKYASAIELLKWSITVQDTKSIEVNWALLIPPILKMIDDIDLAWKAKGCSLLNLLLQRTPTSVLSRTGLGDVFCDTLFPLFTYLPTFTPESESIALFDEVFPALMTLMNVTHPSTSPSLPVDTTSLFTPREKFLDRILRDCILAPLSHAPPYTFPKLGATLISHLPQLLSVMGIHSVKHLQPLTVLLSNILAEPLGLAYPPLTLSAASGLRSLVLNAWPRASVHRGEIIRGICLCWARGEEEEVEGKSLEEIRSKLKEVVDILHIIFERDAEINVVWESEKRGLIRADGRLQELFGS
jgi:tRNA nucleotidyltransferase (CCA-adding enzyme)